MARQIADRAYLQVRLSYLDLLFDRKACLIHSTQSTSDTPWCKRAHKCKTCAIVSTRTSYCRRHWLSIDSRTDFSQDQCLLRLSALSHAPTRRKPAFRPFPHPAVASRPRSITTRTAYPPPTPSFPSPQFLKFGKRVFLTH